MEIETCSYTDQVRDVGDKFRAKSVIDVLGDTQSVCLTKSG